MKIVIDIDEDYYEIIKHDVNVNHNDYKPLKIIANGTPLPNNHGRLIDADVLVEGMEDNYELCMEVNATPTIIPSEREEESEG